MRILMTQSRQRIIALSALLVGAAFAVTSDANETAEIEAIISSMTLEEKASLVVGTGMNLPGADGST